MRVSTSIMQNAFGKYLKAVMDGKEIIITKNERGVAKLVPFQDPMILVKESAVPYSLRRRMTLSEFLEITEKSEAQYELIDGEIYLMASPTHGHQVAIREIFVQMYNFFKGKSCSPLMAPFDVRLKNDSPTFEEDPNIVQPDILVICDAETIDEKGKYHGVPALVVEVLSPSTRGKDMIKKLSLYTLSGVKEYWLVDLDQKQVLVYSLKEGEVQRLRCIPFGSPVQSMVFEDLLIETQDLDALT